MSNEVKEIAGFKIKDEKARNDIALMKTNIIRISELNLDDDDTNLEYAIANYENIIIDKDLTLSREKQINNSDKCRKIYSLNKNLCTFDGCNGFIINKNYTELSNFKIASSSQAAAVTNRTVGITIRASWVVIDNIIENSFYDGIGMYEDVLCVVVEIKNCICSYNYRAGIYMKAVSEAQKNSIVFRRNYLNKNGSGSDDLTTPGDTEIGYGLYISGGLNIACYSNVYEYNTNVGLYIEKGYSLNSFTEYSGYYEQNKRAEIYFDNPDGCWNVNFIDNSYNRPFENVSNAYPRTDIMFMSESISGILNEDRNVNLIYPIAHLKNLIQGNSIFPITNIEKVKSLKLNECCSMKFLNSDNKLYISPYGNWQYYFFVRKNAKYKVRIIFAEGVSSPNFSIANYNNASDKLIGDGAKSLNSRIYEAEFVSHFDGMAFFYQEGSETYQIDYISIIQVG